MVATILIADDDAVQRRLVEKYGAALRLHCRIADSGDAALAHLIDPLTQSPSMRWCWISSCRASMVWARRENSIWA